MSKQNHSVVRDEGKSLIDVESLTVTYDTPDGNVHALRDVSLSLDRGETLGIAGESGSGKSTLALALLDYLDENGRITSGSVRYDGRRIHDFSADELRALRGNSLAHVPQDPNTALNPALRVGEQITETIREHTDKTARAAQERLYELLETVQIGDAAYTADQYPHELSGGMQQRVLIAMALSCDPDLLILDEPTTGLDVTTQATVLDLVRDLNESFNTTIVLITHDLSVIANTCEKAMILYAGEVMETGPVSQVFNSPAHPYTQGLLAAVPRIRGERTVNSVPGQTPALTEIPEGCVFADRCAFSTADCRVAPIDMTAVDSDGEAPHRTRCCHWEDAVSDPIEPETVSERTRRETSSDGDPLLDVSNVTKYFDTPTFLDRISGGDPPVKAVDGVDLSVKRGETLALVGESGCGKSTLGACLVDVLERTSGEITFNGDRLADLRGSARDEFRSNAQIVFQNPHSSLNPRKRIGDQLHRAVTSLTNLDRTARRDRVEELLDHIGLDSSHTARYPHELSGGEKQRVAIARAFAGNPAFVVLDEPVSALDVSVQANILDLLDRLREEYDTSYLFISHDLRVVKHSSDRVAVMYLGKIVEVGSRESVFNPPYHPYTRALLSANPGLDPETDTERIQLDGDVPSARDPPTGCPFHTRCPQYIGEKCDRQEPELAPVETADGDTHHIACHLSADELEDGPEL
ncbi:ABC transporter ATP-binding protein [Natrialba taiwanensis]|uniref:Peptide ABC transporter ATPase n=1 Tax=Natrialba taiwanensis DSM 12281 TaxID=1230458 RepID=M0ADN4_9EURY|nr:ABC transporter ATP-binding protein [Natrialba taiwanensis]ELY96870.1 peptide ABC transporter ATPase [Natrialba taiwanensis DSM 12281]